MLTLSERRGIYRDKLEVFVILKSTLLLHALTLLLIWALTHTNRRPDRWQGHKSKSAAGTCALPESISPDRSLPKMPAKYIIYHMIAGLGCASVFTLESGSSLLSFEMKKKSPSSAYGSV